MTKYILHGGNTSDDHPDNDYFFREITKGLGTRINLLLNYFSRDPNDWNKLAGQDKGKINKQGEGKIIDFSIAEYDKLEEQLKEADVMYMRGGGSFELIEKMEGIKNLKSLFQGKVIAGSSAGVYVLSKYFFSNSKQDVFGGIGILNIKAYCHYKGTDKQIIEKLKNHKEDIEIIALPDYKSVILFR